MLENEAISRTIDQVFSLAELNGRLVDNRQLRIKYGVDVTAPFLHLGHAVNLWMMREMQDAGHRVVFLVGDFTTRIGDPTGKSQTRPVLSPEEIELNTNSLLQQVGHVLRTDPNVFEVRRNSEWYDAMSLRDFLGLLTEVTHARLIQRDMFQKRIEAGAEIYAHELIYPLLQGFDSVMLESDLTIVGSDQLFNEMMGRFYQEKAGQAPQVVVTTRITMGTDGRNKQSKSLNNYIALADAPRDKFGKLMSIPDHLLCDYLTVYTALSSAEVQSLSHQANEDPMGAKLAMAEAVVARYHGPEPAKVERDHFLKVFSRRETPEQMRTVAVPESLTVLELLQAVDPASSKSEHRRLLKQNAIQLDGERLRDPEARIPLSEGGSVLRIGRRRWIRVVADADG